jgi:hypothetical protein
VERSEKREMRAIRDSSPSPLTPTYLSLSPSLLPFDAKREPRNEEAAQSAALLSFLTPLHSFLLFNSQVAAEGLDIDLAAAVAEADVQ